MKRNKKNSSSLAKRNLQKFIANRMAIIGGIIMLTIIAMCICAPLLTSYDPTYISVPDRGLPVSAEHPFGTDRLGRDIFARVLYGGRMSILIGVGSAIGTTMLGAVLGCIAGYYGGKVDQVLVSIQELFSIFPTHLLILLCIAYRGQSVSNLFMIFILTGWPGVMRITRGRILSLKQEPFVESCRANGISGASIMFHHLMPNTWGPVIVNATLSVAGYILQEAALSYLGLGVPDTVVTWGGIINAAKRLDIIQTMPMLWVAPGIAICLFVLGINFFGDGLRDALDPTTNS